MRAWAVVESGAPLAGDGTADPGAERHRGAARGDPFRRLPFRPAYLGRRLRPWRRRKLRLERSRRDLPLAMGHEIVGRVAKLGPDATGREGRRPPHRLPLGRLRRLRQVPGGGGQHVPHRAQPRHFPERRLRDPCLAPHSRHLVDPGALDPALAATYACSGITVFSAIKKLMPLEPTSRSCWSAPVGWGECDRRAEGDGARASSRST